MLGLSTAAVGGGLWAASSWLAWGRLHFASFVSVAKAGGRRRWACEREGERHMVVQCSRRVAGREAQSTACGARGMHGGGGAVYHADHGEMQICEMAGTLHSEPDVVRVAGQRAVV